MKLDYKIIEKELYQPTTMPRIIEVPKMNFITIHGRGNPNNSLDYQTAVETLYGLSYTIKMNHKHILDYVVPPLEGYWHVDNDFKGGGASITDKSKFVWQMMIRQPSFVTHDILMKAKKILSKKKPNLDLSKANLESIIEGLVVQIMHVGPYDDEPETISIIDSHAMSLGYKLDFAHGRRHHEIYISDPRKTEPKKLKTIIRHPIRK